MKKFIVIYHMPGSAMEKMATSKPEDMKEGMAAWMVWAEKCGDGLVDMGTPLGGGQMISQSGTSPSEKGVVGYSILQAKDIAGAEAMLQGHPHLAWDEGCEIEVHGSLALPS